MKNEGRFDWAGFFPKGRRGQRVLAVICFIVAALLPTGALADPPSDAFRYVYDADGRLKAAIDPEGDTATYSWDAAGNLLSIGRSSSTKLAILQLSPTKGEVGETIEIEGTGFSETPASNTVKFNGTAATVKAATPWSLEVEIPAEATSGAVTVQAGGEGPVTSAQSFNVATSAKPTISSLEPTVAAAGDEVTLSGSNFVESPTYDNVVGMNGSRPDLVSASGTVIKFKVPTERLGGHVSVATPQGSSTGPDLFVPPAGTPASKVAATGRVVSGEWKTMTVGSAESIGLLLIDGAAGQRVSLLSKESAFAGTMKFLSPSGAQLGSASIPKSGEGALGPVTMPVSGTYTIVLDPNEAQTGSVKVKTTVFEDVTGSITPSKEGDKESPSLPVVGQRAIYSIAGTAGQRISVKTSNSTFNGYYDLILRNTSGGQIDLKWWWATNSGFWKTFELPSTGTYTLEVDPESTYTGSVDVTVYDAPDITGQTITPSTGGESKTFSVEVPGQRNLITFAGTKDQRISLTGTEATFSGTFKVMRPNGSELASSFGGLSSVHDPVALPETGTYTIHLEGSEGQTGSVKITAVEHLIGSITPSKEGDKESPSLPVVGQRAIYSIAGTAGQRISVKTSNSTFNGYYDLILRNTSGGQIDLKWWWATNSGFWKTFELPSTGTYTLEVDPESTYTGSVDVTVYDAPDITGQTITPSTGGESKTFSVEVPGQRNLITFAGTKDQRISLTGTEATFSGTFKVMRPNGSELASSFGGLSSVHDPVALPETGTYTIHLEGSEGQTGSVKITAVEHLIGSITPSKEGDKESPSLPVVGQRAIYSIAGTAGQRISVKTSNSTFNGYYDLILRNTSGGQIDLKWWWATNSGFWKTFELPSTGTYTLEVDPESTYTGSVDVTVYDAPDITGQTITPSTGGESKTFSVEVPGQRNLITFAGTKDQRISLTGTEATFSGTFKVMRPNGSELASSFGGLSSVHDPVALPETGTYTIHLEGSEGQTGSVKITAVEHLIGSITPSKEGDKESPSLPVVGQRAIYSIAGTAGQRISVKTSNSTFNGYYDLILRNTSGGQIDLKWWWATNSGFWKTFELPSTGTYTLEVDPESTYTGSVDVTVYDAPDITGQTITPTTEGQSITSTIGVPGQRELVTFAGTSGQVVTLKVEEPMFSGLMTTWAPSGSKVSNSEKGFSNGGSAKAEITLPASGTYTVRLEGSEGQTGSLKLTAYLGPHVAWLSPDTGTYELVSLPLETQRGGPPLAYSDVPQHRSGHIEASTDSRKPVEKQKRANHSAARRHAGELRRRAARNRSPLKTSKHRSMRQARPSTRAHTSPPRPVPSRSMQDSNRNAETALPPEQRGWKPERTSWLPPRNSGERNWLVGRSSSPWLDLGPLQANNEATALAGQVLEVNGEPAEGISVAIDGTSGKAETDSTGRFLLEGLPAGHQILLIGGESAAAEDFGTYEIGVDLAAEKTTVLDYTIWLTPLDEAGDLVVGSPTRHEVSLKTSRVPGLEVKMSAGTTITDSEGRAVKDLNITAIPLDRPPFPLPPFVTVPVYFTVQPGGATLSKGARFVYPNWGELAPGERVDFWNYDPEDRGWYVYGRGTVTPDGEQVVPDPGVRVWEFTGAMAVSGPTPPGTGPGIHGAGGGDPVDLHTGLFTYQKRDLALPDTIPISIERTYRPNDSNSYSFGEGATNLYDLRLWPIVNYKEADLILPDGGRVHYMRTSPGTSWSDAIYEPTGPAGTFEGSTIKWNGAGWDMKLANGLTLTFGGFAPLVAISDRHGNKLTIKRSGGQTGNITEIISPHGRWVKFTYDGSNRITKVVDNGGREVKYTYTSGRLTKVEAPAGRVTEFEYDGSGRMKAIVNARGNKYLQNAYDANGRVEKQTTADGGVFEFEYDLSEGGKVEATTITDPIGNEREVEFDAEGFPVAETEAPGTEIEQTTNFERQPETGLVLSETDPLGRKTEFEYDSVDNITEVTKLAGTEDAVTTIFDYEPGTANLIEATDPLGHTTEFDYGPKGELLTRIDALENGTSLKYNTDGQPISITNPEAEETTLAYENGDLASVTDPLGRTTGQFIDALGRVRAVTTPGGQRTTFAYNDADELTGITNPSGAETAIERDKNGNVASITDPRVNETTMAYDVMDRLEAETNPLEDTATRSYDKAGHLIEDVNRNGEISEFDYDNLGRLAKASFGVEGEAVESTIEYEYDDADRLIGVDDSVSGEYVLDYDDLNRLTEFSGPNGTVAYLYDDAGRRAFLSLPGQEPLEYEFDDANRLTGLSRPGEAVSLEYDDADRLTSLVLPNGIEQVYDYDKAGQATSITYKDGEEVLGDLHYAYDVNGRTNAIWGSYARMDLPEALGTGTYNAANQLTKRGEDEFAYDKDGNLMEDGAGEYEWNARGQLTDIDAATDASFSYDPFGRRVSKTIGETTTDVLYDDANVVQESSGEELTASVLTGLMPDQLFSRTTGEGTDSYLTDRLGSLIALANGSGEVDTIYSYEPFGESSEAGEPSDNPFQFTGRDDDGTGLMYYRARYYSPALARFISADPAGFEGSGPNLYWYAYGNPLSYTDPSGECFPCVPSFNPVAPVEDGIDQIGKWASDAPGVASDISDFASGSLTEAELKRAALSEALGSALCAFATRVVVSAPDPRWKAAAAATCLSQRYGGAAEFGIQAADDD